MFSKEDNEKLCRVGPGTPMGEAFRRLWIPFLLPEELKADGSPLRVRLLGEDLIAFRDTEGKLGLLDRYCPHRRVDLFYGRNEHCGLRCPYHGWKFDTTGRVTEMPAEPENSQMLQDTRIKSYPIIEWGGAIWAYMGDPACKPETPPLMEWATVPDSHRYVTKRLQRTNYAQGVEGGIDSSHVGILHSRLDPEKVELPFKQRQVSPISTVPYLASDTAPKFFVRPTRHGMTIGARRNATDDSYYWRITQFLLPFYTMIAPNKEGGVVMGHSWTPIDDYNCWVFTMTWNSERPLSEDERDNGAVHADTKNDGSYEPLVDASSDYGLDREVQRLHSMTGIHGIGMQDTAVQESMGPIVDRSLENLGSGDAAITRFRRQLLSIANELAETGQVTVANNPDWYKVRSAGVVLPHGVDFQEGAAKYTEVK
ncbi:Rieske 2Fe-2S domain-containing protein [Paraburkholderia lycopersici]|uniref:Phenylpropionate dioxygenase, large terminal subunit n=1 Tax=Paraburkholderia lycopersici TaxID=416944 RepID=A0A1G6LXV2_9BURK|nr:Rieske 2Fe-2S domain-containing protein [Paraburkholderia lycopersici]SDC48093.1 Phenylpropionate dioxygenase, large terminal subunit [Paraburkholderia lycopersici]